MRSQSAHSDNRSIKTFFIYTAIVLGLILISLSVRAYYLFQQSKFDGEHQIVIAFGQDKQVEKIISFDPVKQSATIVTLEGENVSFSSIGKKLGVLPNATVISNDYIPLNEDVSTIMQKVLAHYYNIKTNLTIFDVTRLFFVSRKSAIKSLDSKEIVVTKEESDNMKLMKSFFVDDTIFSENVSIQVVNASGESGMGKRLETVLTNLGGNVVAISTSRTAEQSSTISYFGEETYTLSVIKKLLGFPVKNLEQETIADIVITIGEDQKSSSSF